MTRKSTKYTEHPTAMKYTRSPTQPKASLCNLAKGLMQSMRNPCWEVSEGQAVDDGGGEGFGVSETSDEVNCAVGVQRC